ncbi:hypothetical protein [Leisingera sp. XS_AS12]|uniref:hypothetical protein n=1 Tax=Leisingera sp. XS_AS12 TaxID=3241294 RepID=UPI0035179176
MSASHPTFSAGHCFMAQTLNKPEVEEVGALIHGHLKANAAEMDEHELKRWQRILEKMDYPSFVPEEPDRDGLEP